MPVTRTLRQLLDKVYWSADIQGKTGTTSRHPEATNIVEANDAYGRMRTMLINKSWKWELVETALAPLPATRADTNENYSLIDWPTAAQLIARIDVYSRNEWLKLEECDWDEVRLLTPTVPRQQPRPTHFAIKSFGTIATTVLTAGKIALLPFATNGTYKMTHLPRWAGITDVTHIFLYPDDFCVEWHVQSTALKIVQRDKDFQKRKTDCDTALAYAEANIADFTGRAVQTGSRQMRRDQNYRSG